MIRIRNVTPLQKFRVRLLLTNGETLIVDLQPFLNGPIFEPIKAGPALFRTVHVDNTLGTIVWNNGADIDPDVLIGLAKPSWMESKSTVYKPIQTKSTAISDTKEKYRPGRKRKTQK